MRFQPLSVGKVVGVLYGAMGLFVGVIVSLAATIDRQLNSAPASAVAGGRAGA